MQCEHTKSPSKNSTVHFQKGNMIFDPKVSALAYETIGQYDRINGVRFILKLYQKTTLINFKNKNATKDQY